MTHPNPVPELDSLIHRAHRRTVTQAGIEILLTGAAASLAVFSLVLVAGTGLLHWSWALAAALVGAVYLLVVDNVSRLLFSFEIPTGIVTSLIGIPFFVLVLKNAHRSWR